MDRDCGSMTVWAAAATMVIGLCASVALAYGTAVIGRHRVETAADLAALAAAGHGAEGAVIACRAAAVTAGRNGGSLRACRMAGGDVEVEVTRPVTIVGREVRTAVARARAGPVE